MIAYKACYNAKCKNITYVEGKTYTLKGKLVMCENGFHFCKNPEDTLLYYQFDKNFQLMEVEALGEIIEDKVGNKCVTDKIKIVRFIPREETLKLLDIIAEYDDKGNLIHYKISNGYEFWREYDDKGNLIHYKDYKGYEYWNEYDKKGNIIHYKNSKGYECWYKYDEKGNLIHCKDSKGYKCWKEYDENGNLIHHEEKK